MSPAPEPRRKGRAVGRSGWLIQEAGINLYIDPCGATAELPKADVICLSMADPGKVPEDDVRLLATQQTIVAGLPQCVSRFRLNQLPIEPGQTRRALAVEISMGAVSGDGAELVLRYPDFETRYP